MKKVSIIVPIYNTEQYLPRCIDSLINQTLEDIEIILVNDASPDNSISIMNEYKRQYPELVKVIDSKINLKQGGARNLGIRAAKGEYIGFVDSDDWVKPNMYELLYNKAINDKLDIVGCNYIIKNGLQEKLIEQYDLMWWGDKQTTLDQNLKKELLIKGGSVWSKIYKREMLVKHKIYFPEHLFYEDNFFVPIASFFANSFGIVPEALYYYFQDNITATTKRRNSDHHYDRIKTSEMLREWFINNDIEGLYKDEVEYLYTKLMYINTISVILNKYDNVDYEKMKEVRNNFLQKQPEYYKNQYYKQFYSLGKRALYRVNDYNVYVFAFLFKWAKKLIALSNILK